MTVRTFGPALNVLLVAVFAALPVFGLVVGPAYAAMIFGLGALRFLYALAARRQTLRLDRQLVALIGLFVLLCWLSALWSVAPRLSLSGAAQTTGVAVGTLAFLSVAEDLSATLRARLFAVLTAAVAVGAAVMVADTLANTPLQTLLGGPATKYNRGVDYLLLLVWPIAAIAVQRRRWPALAVLAVAMLAIVAISRNTTAQLALPAAAVMLGLAWLAPRLATALLGGGSALVIVALPFALRLLSAGTRGELAPRIKQSLLHRMEIWDYMSAHVVERPIAGWGYHIAKSLTATADQARGYLYVENPNYPHNQWLQLWLETGALGVALALAVLFLVLHRLSRLPAAARPFACAAIAVALVVSLSSFELATDSWWAALAATAFLFRHLVGPPAGAPP